MKTKVFAIVMLLACLSLANNSQAGSYSQSSPYWGSQNYDETSQVWVPAGVLSYYLSVACNNDWMTSAEAAVWCQDGSDYTYAYGDHNWYGGGTSGSITLTTGQTVSVWGNVSGYGYAGVSLYW